MPLPEANGVFTIVCSCCGERHEVRLRGWSIRFERMSEEQKLIAATALVTALRFAVLAMAVVLVGCIVSTCLRH